MNNVAENVTSIASPDTASLTDVTHWITKMAERGIYGGSAATNAITAINRMESILGPEEPRTAAYMLEQMDELARRWALKNQGNPNTATTYRARARTAVQDYLSYLRDPTSFQPKSRAKDESTVRAPKARPAAPSSPAAIPATPASQNLREYPLGADREPFRYLLPPDMTMRDVRRIAFHLITMASDFDPERAMSALNRGEID